MGEKYYFLKDQELISVRRKRNFKNKLDSVLKKQSIKGVRELSKKVSWYTQIVCPYCKKTAPTESCWAVKRYKKPTYKCKRCGKIMEVVAVDAFTAKRKILN